ncbi:type II toxin-antitoxin system VapC family toxin [Rhizobium sp. RAF56]|uniref:type II toxin-antitoxin system VapC family toxin n=1 Tax=Rhizobium sp. RAF56 TaxID=3233062 RepID=UPI003F995748
MIVVDTSVWIDHLRGNDSSAVRRLKSIEDTQDILVGDLILLEVLQGARSEHHAALIAESLRQFEIRSMLDDRLAVKAAHNSRRLREHGITVRKTIDMIIGTFCIENGHLLLHDDRDFEPMAEHLGLRIA